MTVVLITCSYNEVEFVRVGYYVNNEYDTEEMRAEPPTVPQPARILRTILADKPRVTRFPIRWDNILDETQKKPEDEELDRDADVFQPAFSAAPGGEDQEMRDDFEEDEEEEEEDHEEEDSAADGDEDGESEEADDDDDFTSQLGPEEQDRMSMMIDGEDEAMGSAPAAPQDDDAAGENVNRLGDPNSAVFHQLGHGVTKPSPLRSHECDHSDMMMS